MCSTKLHKSCFYTILYKQYVHWTVKDSFFGFTCKILTILNGLCTKGSKSRLWGKYETTKFNFKECLKTLRRYISGHLVIEKPVQR